MVKNEIQILLLKAHGTDGGSYVQTDGHIRIDRGPTY